MTKRVGCCCVCDLLPEMKGAWCSTKNPVRPCASAGMQHGIVVREIVALSAEMVPNRFIRIASDEALSRSLEGRRGEFEYAKQLQQQRAVE